MITTAIIEELLEEDYEYFDMIEGQRLWKSRAVLGLSVEGNFIEGTVLEFGKLYTVRFEKIDQGQFFVIESDCTCGEEFCRHQAAVLYAAQEVKRSPHKRSLYAVKRAEQPEGKKQLPNQLPGKKSGEYRLLPLGLGLNRALQKYGLRRYHRLMWGETFEGTFISPEEIELKTISSRDSYYRMPEKKIRLKYEEGEVYIKCLCCNRTMKTLCEHQMPLLDAAAEALSRFDLSKMPENYQKYRAQLVEQLGINDQALEKYFHIKILEQGITAIGKERNIVNNNWLQSVKNIQVESKEQRQALIKRETAQLEEGRAKRFGMIWANEPDYKLNNSKKLLTLSFAKGGSYKTKDGIKDLSKNVTETPERFPEKIKAVGQQLFFLTQEENPDYQFYQLKELIEENIDLLNTIYHYTYAGSINPYFPKISQLNLVSFVPYPLVCKISFEVIDGMVHLKRHITYNEQVFDYTKVVYANTVFCSTKKTAYLFSHPRFQEFMEIFPDGYNSVILTNPSKEEITNLVSQLRNHFEVEVPEQLLLEEAPLTDGRLQILLREAGNFILFEPRIKYENHSFNAFEEEDYFVEDKLYRVNEEDRTFLVNFLKQAHPEFDNEFQVQEYVYLSVNEMINNYWFIHFNEACEAAGIEVLGQNDLSKFKYSKHRAETYMHIKSGIDWFDVEAGVSFGKEKVKTADWIRALRNKESFVKLKDGSLGMLPEEWLQQASKILAVADVEKGQLKISKYRFNIVEDLFEEIDDQKIIQELREKKARLRELDTNKTYELPDIVTATLRDYQKHGFAWLKFLNESGFGGILADDMGLGKTVQVITLLADQIDNGPCMVIVPRSLLFNWAAELDKFCPTLKYKIHHGPDRARNFESLRDFNIIITTYHTATNDIQIFKDVEFNYIVLDESQAIKNPDSKRYKAMRVLQSRHKLAMTGTPIENNTFDLFAQLSFTSPGLLGGKTSFKNNFSIPIDNNRDTEAAAFLRKLVHPFILRRTKEQVAKELPEKTETIIYCEMETAQRRLYENLKAKIKQDIEEAIEQKGVNQSKFQILDGLLRLRQMCNSPLLVNSSFSGANANSVKINTLLENLEEALDQKHHALVFSQFVSLLTIVRQELDKRGIKYAYLDGSTTKRQAEVDKFMNNDEIKIFLISIKAGNTGMNLTKADYVYIIDPWWNPAVEAQAIDRTHRIGQKNQIFAYKLICKNSIEEKILKLQERKKKIASEIIQTDENILKSLNKEDLMALFD
ncbi:MAG: DEAD/DEAH box helicase [Bacteroidota bacterium]